MDSFVLFYQVRNKQRSGTVVTDEMREEFAEFWEQHKYDPLSARNILLASFCPQVKESWRSVVMDGIIKFHQHFSLLIVHIYLKSDDSKGFELDLSLYPNNFRCKFLEK